MNRIEFDEDTQKKILDLYESNISSRKIIKELNLGCSQTVILHFLKRNNINLLNTNRKYFFNENFFETIDTEDKAYWLGFIYADGNVYKNTLKINLSVKDKDFLEKFKKAINFPKKLEVGVQDAFGNEVGFVRLAVYSIKMVNDLIDKGCVPKKSLILKFPTEEQVPPIFLKDFIRGYFDGDGSYVYGKKSKQYTMSFCGTQEFLEGVKNFFEASNPVVHDKRHLDKNICFFRMGGNLNVLSKSQLLYENSSIYLERKFNVYKKIKKQYTPKVIKERSKFSSLLR